jgi:hypothetical protein
MARLYRGNDEIESFDDLHADLDEPIDHRSRVQLQLAKLGCEAERFRQSCEGLKLARTIVILLLASLVIWAVYAGIDPLPIIKELLAGGLRE